MDAEKIRAEYKVEPPEFGYRVIAFTQIDPSTVEFSAILSEQYDHVTELAIDWSYSKYHCSGVRFLSLDLPITELTGHDGQFLQMFWEYTRNCFIVDASAGFIFDCDVIEVVDSTSEKIGPLAKELRREQSNPADPQAGG